MLSGHPGVVLCEGNPKPAKRSRERGRLSSALIVTRGCAVQSVTRCLTSHVPGCSSRAIANGATGRRTRKDLPSIPEPSQRHARPHRQSAHLINLGFRYSRPIRAFILQIGPGNGMAAKKKVISSDFAPSVDGRRVDFPSCVDRITCRVQSTRSLQAVHARHRDHSEPSGACTSARSSSPRDRARPPNASSVAPTVAPDSPRDHHDTPPTPYGTAVATTSKASL